MPGDESMHLILAPFPAQGHFAAFLSLAERLHTARSSAVITLVSTQGNVAALRASAAAATPFLRFHALPFSPEEHGLPAGAESADAVHVRYFLALFQSTGSPLLQAAFDAFVDDVCAGGAPAFVVADPFLAWTTAVARRRGARHAFFDSCGAYGSAVYHSLWKHLPHLRAPPGAAAFALPDHPEVTVYRSQLPSHFLRADGTDPWSLFQRRQVSLGYDTDAVLVNTMEELEPAGLRMLRRALGVPVLPFGPLLRVRTQNTGHGDPDSGSDSIVRWLDPRDRSSVLYISFGSQNSLRPDQMMELAAALELTDRPFVWAFRPPITFDDDDDSNKTGAFGSGKWLPEGFEERARAGDRGLVVRGWAPQLRILAHASTGAFLSHCGWNSVLESVAHGVPIIGWPLQGDQFFNCKMLEEWGACVEVARGNAEGSPAVERARLAEAMEAVLGGTAKGAEVRRRAKGIQELVGRAWSKEDGGGSSAQGFEEFFTLMLHGIGAAAKEC
ncbi:unnamed protein product [Urochloa humidicola]